jgi:hypothetical protein
MPATDSPAGRTIQKFGGITRCAKALGRPKSTIQRWKDSGYIHPNYYPAILDAAVAERVQLDVRDFNPVDVNHPAFAAKFVPSADSTSARVASSHETQ